MTLRTWGSGSRALATGLFMVCALGLWASPATAQSESAEAAPLGDVERGRLAFGVCRPCHEVGPRARHKTGPHLNGLFGRTLGGEEEYPYSLPMVAAGLSGLYWDDTLLDIYIWRPKSIVPMSEKWLVDENDLARRRDIIAYIRAENERAEAAAARR